MFSTSECDSSNQPVSVIVVMNYFTFWITLKPLNGFASNFVWMFLWVYYSLNNGQFCTIFANSFSMK